MNEWLIMNDCNLNYEMNELGLEKINYASIDQGWIYK